MRSDNSLLFRYLALVWGMLTLYGSLYPLSGWEGLGEIPFAFLTAPWPRYWTVFDLLSNILVYMPLGFFATLALWHLPGRLTAPVLASVAGILLSLSMEILQNGVPTRIPSNVDWGANSLGAILGSVLAFWTGPRVQYYWQGLRQGLVAPVPHADWGLTLLSLWLLTLLSPEILLFGTGDLRSILTGWPALAYEPGLFRKIEIALVACNSWGVGLFVALLSRGWWRGLLALFLFFTLAILVRSLGAALLLGPTSFLQWWTPGIAQGLAMGGLLLLFSLPLAKRVQVLLAMTAVILGLVLVNLAPLDPYSYAALALWRQGHFLNFNGLTRWVALIWPLFSLAYFWILWRRL